MTGLFTGGGGRFTTRGGGGGFGGGGFFCSACAETAKDASATTAKIFAAAVTVDLMRKWNPQ